MLDQGVFGDRISVFGKTANQLRRAPHKEVSRDIWIGQGDGAYLNRFRIHIASFQTSPNGVDDPSCAP
jgi:hypothetical protein